MKGIRSSSLLTIYWLLYLVLWALVFKTQVEVIMNNQVILIRFRHILLLEPCWCNFKAKELLVRSILRGYFCRRGNTESRVLKKQTMATC